MPPLTEKKLLELSVTSPGLPGAQARVAGLLRVFVITWDPLEHQASRPEGFATINVDHDGSELVVYLPIWSLVDSAAHNAPRSQPSSVRWPVPPSPQPPRTLAAAAQPQVVCPACVGRRFGFPADPAESQARMCPPHRVKADTVIRARLARANASNPDGWAAITDASSRIDRPHLPGGLATKLANAPQGMDVVAEPAELADRARLVIEAAGWFPGRANDFAVALGEEPDLAGFLPDWLVNLVADLARTGLGAEAVAVGDALATVDPGLHSMLDGDVAVALAQAGLVDQAVAKIEENVTRWPDDFWIRVHAGDALLALVDPAGAATHFPTAVDLAEQADDFEARSDAIERLQRLERLNRPERPGSKPEPGRRPLRNQKAAGGRSRRIRRR